MLRIVLMWNVFMNVIGMLEWDKVQTISSLKNFSIRDTGRFNVQCKSVASMNYDHKNNNR